MVELGTKAHPYKNLGFVFVELLNYHSHYDQNISIYVMENTNNYIYVENSFIVNITLVEMLSYSDDETVTTPGKPIITAIEREEMTNSRGTSLNILQNYEMRTSEIIVNNSNITDYESLRLQAESYVFIIIKSSFHMDNFELTTIYKSLLDRLFFYPVYIQHRLIKLTNIDFRIIGI